MATPILSLLSLLWLLVGPMTVMPMDELPSDWNVTEHHELVKGGLVMRAALGCHGADDIRYYRRTLPIHLEDVKRERPDLGFGEQVAEARHRFVETEIHELTHAWACRATGNLYVLPPKSEIRAFYAYLGLDPDDWTPRPKSWAEASRLLGSRDFNGVDYCRASDHEWIACLTAALAVRP